MPPSYQTMVAPRMTLLVWAVPLSWSMDKAVSVLSACLPA